MQVVGLLRVMLVALLLVKFYIAEVLTYETQLKGSVKEQNMFHNYETEKITCKASDMAENLQL